MHPLYDRSCENTKAKTEYSEEGTERLIFAVLQGAAIGFWDQEQEEFTFDYSEPTNGSS